jgi:uncharacterized protein
MRKLLRLLIPASVIYVLLCAAAAVFLAETTLHPNRRPLSAAAEVQMRDTAAPLQSEVADVQIPAADNAALSAWFIHPRHSNGDAVILLHGLGDNRLGTIGYAELLLKHGYSVLTPDARAHGASGGRIATMALSNKMTCGAGLSGLQETNSQVAFTRLENPWEPRSSYSR